MNFEEILSCIDIKRGPEWSAMSLEQQKETDEMRYLLSEIKIKRQVLIYNQNPELPVNLHEYLVNNDILLYPNLRQPNENQIVHGGTDKPDSILIWVNNPNISTLQKVDDEVYVHAVYEMEKSLRYIYRELSVLDNDQYETTLAFQSMMHIIDICQRSAVPSLLADELYLQMFRYQNKLEVQDGHFAGEHQLYKVLATFALYVPPSKNLMRFILAWLYQKSLRFQLQKPAKKALQHLLSWQAFSQNEQSQEQNANKQYIMPDWLPDIGEIKQRFRCNPNLEVQVQTLDKTVHSIIVSESATVTELMEAIYQSELLGGIEDKYSYWVYKEVYKDKIVTTAEEEIIMFEDVPLLKEEGVMEAMSHNSIKYPNANKKFTLKRRIFCAYYQFTHEIIKGQHFNYFFAEISRNYIERQYLVQQYDKDAVISLSALLYIINIKEDMLKKTIDITKDNRQKGIKRNEEEIKQKVMNETIAQMDERIFKEKIRQFVPLFVRHIIPQDELQKNSSSILRDYFNLGLEDLKQIFAGVMLVNPCSLGTSFHVKAYEAFQETSTIKTDALFIINTFGLTFYEWKGALQKPYKVYLYEEIIGISVSQKQLRLHVSNVEKQFRIILTFTEERAIEAYQEIVSYMILRTNEYTRPLYAYNELFRMVVKENLFLNQTPNRNQIVQYILSQFAQQEQQQNTKSSFFNQVSKVTKRGQMIEQLNQINQTYFDDEKYIQLLIKKQQTLQLEAEKVSLNTLMYQHFPFHLDCPFITKNKSRIIKQTDVSKFFGKNARLELKKIFDPKREKFGKAILPYIQSDTSDTPSNSNKQQPQQGKGKSKSPLTSKSNQSILDKYNEISDDLLNELKEDNSKFRNVLNKNQQNTPSNPINHLPPTFPGMTVSKLPIQQNPNNLNPNNLNPNNLNPNNNSNLNNSTIITPNNQNKSTAQPAVAINRPGQNSQNQGNNQKPGPVVDQNSNTFKDSFNKFNKSQPTSGSQSPVKTPTKNPQDLKQSQQDQNKVKGLTGQQQPEQNPQIQSQNQQTKPQDNKQSQQQQPPQDNKSPTPKDKQKVKVPIKTSKVQSPGKTTTATDPKKEPVTNQNQEKDKEKEKQLDKDQQEKDKEKDKEKHQEGGQSPKEKEDHTKDQDTKPQTQPKPIKYLKGTAPSPSPAKSPGTTPDQQLKDLFSKYRKPQDDSASDKKGGDKSQDKSANLSPKPESQKSSQSGGSKKPVFTKPVITKKTNSQEKKDDNPAGNQSGTEQPPEQPKKVPISFKKTPSKPQINEQQQEQTPDSKTQNNTNQFNSPNDKDNVVNKSKDPPTSPKPQKQQNPSNNNPSNNPSSPKFSETSPTKPPQLGQALTSALSRFPGKGGPKSTSQLDDKSPSPSPLKPKDDTKKAPEQQQKTETPTPQPQQQQQQQIPPQSPKPAKQETEDKNQAQQPQVASKSPANSDGNSQSSKSTNRKGGPPKIIKTKKF